LLVSISCIEDQERLAFANKTYERWMGVGIARALGQPLHKLLDHTLCEQRQPNRHAARAPTVNKPDRSAPWLMSGLALL
jgi:hypothetical protein